MGSCFPSTAITKVKEWCLQNERGLGIPDLLNLASDVTGLSQLTLYPLGLLVPSSTFWGGGQSGEVGVRVSELSRPPTQMLSFYCMPVSVQGAVTVLGK